MLKVNAGDELEIKVGRKPVLLVPMGVSDKDACGPKGSPSRRALLMRAKSPSEVPPLKELSHKQVGQRVAHALVLLLYLKSGSHKLTHWFD